MYTVQNPNGLRKSTTEPSLKKTAIDGETADYVGSFYR